MKANNTTIVTPKLVVTTIVIPKLVITNTGYVLYTFPFIKKYLMSDWQICPVDTQK